VLGIQPNFRKPWSVWLWRNGFIGGKVVRDFKGRWLVSTGSVNRSPNVLVRENLESGG
jgi:hypothetical protein